jgi:hypothetical protein
MKIAHAKLSLADRAARLQQALKSATPAPGRYADARNLYLKVSPTFAKSWVFMWQANGQQREMGLGSATGAGSTFSLTLAQARLAADKARATIAAGNNPIASKVQTKIIAVTFRRCRRAEVSGLEPRTQHQPVAQFAHQTRRADHGQARPRHHRRPHHHHPAPDLVEP